MADSMAVCLGLEKTTHFLGPVFKLIIRFDPLNMYSYIILKWKIIKD